MVSIVVPVVRTEKGKRCIRHAIKNAGISPAHIEIVTEYDTHRIGAPEMVKRLVGMTSHDLVMFLGDDTIPQPGYMRHALDAMQKLPGGWGLVGLNDQQRNGKTLATHWLADKRMLNLLDGEFFCTDYRHCFCDRELTDIAIEHDRYIWAEDAKIEHDHPMFTHEESDIDYQRAYDKDTYINDWKTYVSRKITRYGFKLGIGLPVANRQQDKDFWLSFLMADKPDYTILVPSVEVYNFPQDIAHVRNDLANQALNEGCSHLLMMDTDQVYKPDTITKLLAHDVDVVGALVHRRYPPFSPILYRGTLGNYEYVPDDEMFSGELVEVDATGCGCILFNTGVFIDTDYPWFKIEKKDGKTVGEDIGFCSRIRSKGYKVFVDTSATVDHITTFRVNRSTYELFKRAARKGD